MSTTELIPKIEFDSPLETALATNDQFLTRLMPLKTQANSIEVIDADTYARLGAVLSEVRSIRKNEIAVLWAPFTGVVNRVRDFLKQKQAAADNLCEEIDGMCRAKLKAYEVKEKAAAAAEEKQLNKKSETPVEVKPNIPTVAGYRKSTTYPVMIEDPKAPKALLRALLRAYKSTDTKRLQFLSQFVMIDEKALASHARKTADVAKFNKEMHGTGVTCRME